MTQKGGSRIVTINPATEERLREYPLLGESETDRLLTVASAAQHVWRRESLLVRAEKVANLAMQLSTNVTPLAQLISQEMGKPIVQAEREVSKCALSAQYLAAVAPELLADLPPLSTPDPAVLPLFWRRATVKLEPQGVLLGVMPWNFPVWQVIRFAVPAILGGNAVLIKHAPNVSGVAEFLQTLFEKAGFPPGVYADLRIPVELVAGVIRDQRISGVSLTGSVGAGRAVAAECGQALKKCVLELGGSDPFVVWNDVSLPAVIDSAVTARMQNSGQSCIAAKRFLVHADIFAEFSTALVAAFSRIVIGDPLNRHTELGPIARADLLVALRAQVASFDPNTVRSASKALPDKGFYFPPTVIVHDPSGTSVHSCCVSGRDASCEELFGPVAQIFKVGTIAEAISVANQTDFGLGASIWTQSQEIAQQFVDNSCSGSVFVNTIVQSDPRLPFGGVKDSGFGRELGSIGSREFLNAKTVVWN